MDDQQKRHHIKANASTRVNYFVSGYVTPQACQGGSYYHNGIQYHEMVVSAYRQFHLFTYDAMVDDQEIVSIDNLDLVLPCPLSHRYCKTQRYGTFTWNPLPQHEQCHFHHVRDTKGIVITDENHQETFISTDKTMIRLILDKPQSQCGHVMFGTSYQKLFLSEDVVNPGFPKGLPPSEMSIWTYANQQDGFMMGELTRYIKHEFENIHQESCRRALHERKFNYDRILTEQHGAIDGDTAALGGGYFLTVAGEAFYRYRCKRLIVRARPTSCLLYTSPSPRDKRQSRMPSSA